MCQTTSLTERYKVINLESALKLDEFLYEKNKKVDVLLLIEFMRRGYDTTTLYSMKKFKEESEKMVKKNKSLTKRCTSIKQRYEGIIKK